MLIMVRTNPVVYPGYQFDKEETNVHIVIVPGNLAKVGLVVGPVNLYNS
jgi:hypothetical protein